MKNHVHVDHKLLYFCSFPPNTFHYMKFTRIYHILITLTIILTGSNDFCYLPLGSPTATCFGLNFTLTWWFLRTVCSFDWLMQILFCSIEMHQEEAALSHKPLPPRSNTHLPEMQINSSSEQGRKAIYEQGEITCFLSKETVFPSTAFSKVTHVTLMETD